MKYIIANWKSNGNQQNITNWCQIISADFQPMAERQFVICPPLVYLSQFRQHLGESLKKDQLSLGGQDIGPYPAGAYTGEIHGGMLVEAGCRYVLIGHSERRKLFNESDELLYAKLEQAQNHGLIAVFCIGETQEEHLINETDRVIREQLNPIIRFSESHQDTTRMPIIAYEPVWAIGTGLAASPQLVNKTHIKIKEHIEGAGHRDGTVIYGGSVKANNAAEFIRQTSIDGLLVGGASLDAKEILNIYFSDTDKKIVK